MTIYSLPIELTAIVYGFIPDLRSKCHFQILCKACNGAVNAYKNTLEEGWQEDQENVIDAVARRGLNIWEGMRLGNMSASFEFDKDSSTYNEEEVKYKQAQTIFDTFYEVFNNRCVEFNIGYTRIDYCFFLAVKGFKKIAEVHRCDPAFEIKFIRTIENFSRKMIVDIAEDFANQRAECITMASFIEKERQMLRIYSAVDLSKEAMGENCFDVEYYLRNVLQRTHESDFQRLAAEYLDPTHPKVAVIRQQIASELENTTDDRILKMRTSNEAEKMHRFYKQLTIEVLAEQKRVRYHCMREILADSSLLGPHQGKK